MTTITHDAPLARNRRLTRATAATAYRPVNLRPKGYQGRRRATAPSIVRGVAGANPVWLLGVAAGALWATAVVLADQMGIFGKLLPW
jgi:hypothetical protein